MMPNNNGPLPSLRSTLHKYGLRNLLNDNPHVPVSSPVPILSISYPPQSEHQAHQGISAHQAHQGSAAQVCTLGTTQGTLKNLQRQPDDHEEIYLENTTSVGKERNHAIGNMSTRQGGLARYEVPRRSTSWRTLSRSRQPHTSPQVHGDTSAPQEISRAPSWVQLCMIPDCSRVARRKKLCFVHGGRSYCKFPGGCPNVTQKGGLDFGGGKSIQTSRLFWFDL